MQGGEIVFAQFDLWRSNWEDDYLGSSVAKIEPPETYGPPPPYPDYNYSDVNFLLQVQTVS